MLRYVHQSGTENLRSTTTASTVQNNNDNSSSTAITTTAPTSRWVLNLSSYPWTKAQEKLLPHGPNLAITPRCPHIGGYMVVIEQTCQNLTQGEADELTAEVKAVLKKIQPPRPNISTDEQRTLKELKKDNNRVILTADKGVCLVVMDKEEYIKKAEELLNHQQAKEQVDKNT